MKMRMYYDILSEKLRVCGGLKGSEWQNQLNYDKINSIDLTIKVPKYLYETYDERALFAVACREIKYILMTRGFLNIVINKLINLLNDCKFRVVEVQA